MSKLQRTNTTGALGISGSTRAADLAAFDALPPRLRRMVWEEVVNLSSESMLAFFQSIARQAMGDLEAAEDFTARKLLALRSNEIEVFSGRHRARHGTDTPAVLAGASVQPYGARGPARRRGVGMARQPRLSWPLVVDEVAA